MIRISEIEQIMRPNFVWDRAGLKPLQVNEYYEKNKELARIVFVGLCAFWLSNTETHACGAITDLLISVTKLDKP